jgi:hypothetical protein
MIVLDGRRYVVDEKTATGSGTNRAVGPRTHHAEARAVQKRPVSPNVPMPKVGVR